MVIKLKKYMEAGVKEYWVVDPKKKLVLVYDFQKDVYPEIHGFEDTITISLMDGGCTIDLAEMYEEIRFLYE